jgi:RNA-directed DNA polymerase
MVLQEVYEREFKDFSYGFRPGRSQHQALSRLRDDLMSMRGGCRVLAVLAKRFAKYGLTLHPDKTRLVRFERPRKSGGGSGDEPRPGSFDFLGFTHYWAKSRKGCWVIKQRTARDRLSRSLRRLGQWCRANRHAPLRVQRDELNRKLKGHYGYYGITGNYDALVRFYRGVCQLWRKWLSRRSHRGRRPWEWFNALLERLPLARPTAVHSTLRLTAKS